MQIAFRPADDVQPGGADDQDAASRGEDAFHGGVARLGASARRGWDGAQGAEPA